MIIDAELYLEHHGVKGMRWGQRKAARQTNRQLNKASRQKDLAKRDAAIEEARQRIKSGEARTALLSAKEEFHKNKAKMGSREARKILNQTREKNWEDQQVAQQAKSGKETTIALLATVGVIGIGALMGAGR